MWIEAASGFAIDTGEGDVGRIGTDQRVPRRHGLGDRRVADCAVDGRVSEGIAFAEPQSGIAGPAHARPRFASIASNTGSSSPGELADDLEHVGGGRLLLAMGFCAAR